MRLITIYLPILIKISGGRQSYHRSSSFSPLYIKVGVSDGYVVHKNKALHAGRTFFNAYLASFHPQVENCRKIPICEFCLMQLKASLSLAIET